MPILTHLNVALVGAAGRGGSFRSALEANGARIHAVCDIRQEALDECAARLGVMEKYLDYEEMLDRSEIDAVVVGTPMPLHVPQSIAALERGKHVLCEVPAAVSVEEAKTLVRAAAASPAVYMMAENYTYMRPNVLVRELATRGLFGEVYYAEGEYLHNVRDLAEVTTWRRHWQLGIDGITYCTHSLGPLLQWMPGDRVRRLTCEGSGVHYADPRGEPYAQDTSVMLCKTVSGRLLKIRVDLISNRPHAMTNYQLQGTEGVYESDRGGPHSEGRLWLRSLSEDVRWHDLESIFAVDELAAKYVPDLWRNPPEEARRAGHGGGDFFEVWDWVRAIKGEAACPIGIHEAMDMTLPGLVSQESIREWGEWHDVPDSRQWLEPERGPQLRLIWPEGATPPAAQVPAGYELRLFRDGDLPSYRRLLAKVDFGDGNDRWLEQMLDRMLPRGFVVVEHTATGEIVATAMATHWPLPEIPYGAELGWVAADPDHRGRGLGLAASAAATARMLECGFTVYLRTDDWRLPALRMYLGMGYRPLLFADGMRERWVAVYEKLGKVWDGG